MPQNPQAQTPEAQAFEAWKQDPVTRRYFDVLRQAREERKEEWARTGYLTGDHIESAMKNAESAGICEFISWLLDMEVQHLYPNEE